MFDRNETLAEWDARHGGDSVMIDREWCLFSDGAMRTKGGQFSQLIEPPSDTLQLAKLIVRFHETKLQNLVGQFDEYKQSLLGNGFLDTRLTPDEHYDHLLGLKAKVDAEKADLAAALDILNTHPLMVAESNTVDPRITFDAHQQQFYDRVSRVEV